MSSSAADTLTALTDYFSFYAYILLLIAGVIGNTLNILVFSHLKFFRANRCSFYLIVESIVDIIELILSSTNNTIKSISGSSLSTYSLVSCQLLSLALQLCILISFSTVCFAAYDQFCSTCYRYNLKKMCTFKVARRLTFVACCLSLVHSVVFCLFFNLQPSLGCVISNPRMIQYLSIFLYPVLYGLLPIVVSSTFSFLAFSNVRRIVRRQISIRRRRLDRQLTSMFLMRIGFFVLYTLPYALYRIYTINNSSTTANPLAYATERLVQVIFFSFFNLNFASNFYIFMSISSRYRRQVKHVLVKKCWRRWTRRC